MHIAFNLELKAQGSHEDFVSEEIDVFLNRATRAYIDERKPRLRTDEIALSDLRTLLETERLENSDVADYSLYDNVVAADLTELSEAFEFAVSARATLSVEGNPAKVVRFFSMEEFIDQLVAEGHSPVWRRLPATVHAASMLVAYDETDDGVDALTITYLRPPATVSLTETIDSDLPEHAHQEIVSRAVGLARASLAATE